MAREREQAVVRVGVDRDGHGAERGDEAVQVRTGRVRLRERA